MNQAAINALAYYTAVFWLLGYAVGLITKLIAPQY